jgi:hypothetical protein
LGQFCNVLITGSPLTVEDGSNGYLITTKNLADGLEGKILGFLLSEQERALRRQLVNQILLFTGLIGRVRYHNDQTSSYCQNSDRVSTRCA